MNIVGLIVSPLPNGKCDGLGRRISRDGPGGFEEFLYDDPNVIVILDSQVAVVSTLSYYPGVDRPQAS